MELHFIVYKPIKTGQGLSSIRFEVLVDNKALQHFIK